MLFDELQLKFNEGKFVSTVRQPDLFAPSSLGTDACERLLQELEPGKCFVFLFESKVSFILSHCWEMKKKKKRCINVCSCSEQTSSQHTSLV